MVGLGDLPGGKFKSAASAVSADGSVVVGWSNSASGREAIRWTREDGIVGLGDLPGGMFKSWATAVSADGLVVVGGSGPTNGGRAFVWTPASGMRNFKDVLENDFGLDVPWWPKRAYGISADGATIVGIGISKGWIARVPIE